MCRLNLKKGKLIQYVVIVVTGADITRLCINII